MDSYEFSSQNLKHYIYIPIQCDKKNNFDWQPTWLYTSQTAHFLDSSEFMDAETGSISSLGGKWWLEDCLEHGFEPFFPRVFSKGLFFLRAFWSKNMFLPVCWKDFSQDFQGKNGCFHGIFLTHGF